MKKKNTLLILGLIFFALQSFAQFSQVWSANYQHSSSPGFSNQGRFVTEDVNGNVFVLSDVTSDEDPSGQQSGSTFHYVVLNKYSTNGALMNSLNIDVYGQLVSGYSRSSAFGLLTDASGNIYIGYATYDAATGYDIALGKYDNNLARIWTNTWITPDNESGVDLQLHPSGTLYAAIKTAGPYPVYSVIESVNGSAPSSLVYSYPPGFIVINSIALDGANTLYAGGSIFKSSYRNALVSALNISTHSVIWNSMYSPKGIVGHDIINEVTVGVDGNIYSVGTSDQGINGNQVVVLKNSPSSPRLQFVELLRGANSATAGLFINASESGWLYIGAASATDPLAYIFRIPDDGVFTYPGYILFNPEPGVTYNSINGISLFDMKISSSKNIYITGSIDATGPSGDFTCSYLYKAGVVFGNALIQSGAWSVDGQPGDHICGIGLSLDYTKSDVYWLRNRWNDFHISETVELIDLNAPSPLRESKEMHSVFTAIVSNDGNLLHIKAEEEISRLELFDAGGRTVRQVDPSSVEIQLDISTLSSGIYFCKVRTAKGFAETRKFARFTNNW